MSASYPAPPHLVAIPPGPFPHDNIDSALFLPLSAISVNVHRGKKIRTIGQVIDYDPSSSLLLLSAHSTETAQRPTLFVNVSIPLMGPSPAMKDMYETPPAEGELQRPRVKFDKGEWVCVVGWLEGTPHRRIAQNDLGAFLPPLPLVLDLIHISPTREPPLHALFRGDQI